MATKRRARRPSSGDSKEMGHNSGNEGSDEEEEEESGESGETAMSPKPKEIPLKQAEQPSPPSPKYAGAQGSGKASPARSAPRGGPALQTKTTISKRVKKPPPASQEEDEAEDSGDASPARGPLPDDTADAGHNKRPATPKRGEKRSRPPRQEEERPEKRAAGPDAETAAASAPRHKKKSKRSAEKDRRKKKKRKQLKKALLKPTSPPQLLQLELNVNDNREDTPSLPDIAQDDELHGREMAEQEHSNTSPPLDEHRGREEEQQEKKNTEQEHAGDTSPPHDKDMHTAHGEEQQEKQVANQECNHSADLHDRDMHSAYGEEQPEKEAANQEHANDTSTQKDNHIADEEEQQGEDHSADEEEQQRDSADEEDQQRDSADEEEQQGEDHSADEEEQQREEIPQQEQPSDTSPPQEKNRVQEDEETGAQVNAKALQVRNKKPAVERSWSYDDEFKILNALVAHAQSHNGDLPDSAHLLAILTFDKVDANEDKLNDKIRKLRTRYRRFLLQGCPSDNHIRRLFKLSEILWGQVDEDERVEATSRDFSVLSKLYPHLAKEVKAYAETHSSGDVIMAMFMTIGDEKARDLDAKCKKQQIEAFKLELGQASLTSELLSALSSLTHVKF